MKEKDTKQKPKKNESGNEDKKNGTKESNNLKKNQDRNKEESTTLNRNYKERIHGYPDGPGGGYNGL